MIFQAYIVWTKRIHSLKYHRSIILHWHAKIYGIENQSLWQKLNSFFVIIGNNAVLIRGIYCIVLILKNTNCLKPDLVHSGLCWPGMRLLSRPVNPTSSSWASKNIYIYIMYINCKIDLFVYLTKKIEVLCEFLKRVFAKNEMRGTDRILKSKQFLFNEAKFYMNNYLNKFCKFFLLKLRSSCTNSDF